VATLPQNEPSERRLVRDLNVRKVGGFWTRTPSSLRPSNEKRSRLSSLVELVLRSGRRNASGKIGRLPENRSPSVRVHDQYFHASDPPASAHFLFMFPAQDRRQSPSDRDTLQASRPKNGEALLARSLGHSSFILFLPTMCACFLTAFHLSDAAFESRNISLSWADVRAASSAVRSSPSFASGPPSCEFTFRSAATADPFPYSGTLLLGRATNSPPVVTFSCPSAHSWWTGSRLCNCATSARFRVSHERHLVVFPRIRHAHTRIALDVGPPPWIGDFFCNLQISFAFPARELSPARHVDVNRGVDAVTM